MARITLMLAAMVALLLVAGLHAENQTYDNVMAYLETQKNYTMLVSLLKTSGLSVYLSYNTVEAVLLAPSNNAFNAVAADLQGLNISLQNGTDRNTDAGRLLTNILSAHVIPRLPGNVILPGLGSWPTRLNTTGNITGNLTITTSDTGVLTNRLLFGVAPGTNVDPDNSVVAGKARIYFLTTTPLLPPVRNKTTEFLTISEALASRPELSGFTCLATTTQNYYTEFSSADTIYTVFAPTNDALEAYKKKFGPTALSGSQNSTALFRNHVLSRPYLSSQVPTIATTFATQTLALTLQRAKSGNNVTVSGPGNDSPADVVKLDLKAGKSVIHIINKVLLPAADGLPSPRLLAGVLATASPPPSPSGSLPTASQLLPSCLAIASPPPPPGSLVGTLVEKLADKLGITLAGTLASTPQLLLSCLAALALLATILA